jgi:hypothetical protein
VGGLLVAGEDRVGERPVLEEDLLRAVRAAGERGEAHPALAVAQGVVQREQDGVAGRGDEEPVEGAVGLHEPGRVARRRALVLDGERLLRLGAEVAPVADDLLPREALDHQPGFQDVLDLRRGDGDHERPALGVQPQQALGLQAQERLADRRAAERDAGRDVALRDEVAAREAPVEDPLLREPVRAVGRRHVASISHP